MERIKDLIKTTHGKIGLGIIIFGLLSVVATQASGNGTTFGQSLLVGGVFFLIGAAVIIIGKKKAPMLSSTDAEPKELSPGMVYVYAGSKVYHTHQFCCDSVLSEPLTLNEEDAQDKGYRKCKKCEKYDQTPN